MPDTKLEFVSSQKYMKALFPGTKFELDYQILIKKFYRIYLKFKSIFL